MPVAKCVARRVMARQAGAVGGLPVAGRTVCGLGRPVIAMLAVAKRLGVPSAHACASLMHRKLGELPFRHLAFHTRQRGANEPPMHRTVVIGMGGMFGSRRLWLRRVRGCRSRLDGRSLDCRAGEDRRRLVVLYLRRLLLFGFGRRRHGGGLARDVGGHGFLSALGQFGFSILVFGFARRTSGLANHVADHCHDCMVADATFARAIVVNEITNP